MKTNNDWNVIYTRPNMEKMVLKRLGEISIRSYCPLQKKMRIWSDRKKIVEEPLFKSYIFVETNEQVNWQVLSVSGVVKYVTEGGKPAVVREKEIERIKLFLNEAENITLTNQCFKKDDTVKVISGIFMDSEALVKDVNKHTVVLDIPVLGCSLRAIIHKKALIHIEQNIK